MAYAELKDLQEIYGNNEILKLLPNKEDTSPFVRALESASSEIDLYISKRYKTPLTEVPAIITEWTCAIAFYKRSFEYGTGLTEERRKRYDDIFVRLADISTGKGTIPELDKQNEEGETETYPKGKKHVELMQDRRSRIFTRRTMEGL